MTALLAAFGVLALYSQFVDPVSPYASQLVVLIGLAVAVDYSLFMISRFRTERAPGANEDAAIRVASATAGRAVFFCGLAVMISIAGLFLLDDPLFRSMAVGTIAVVFISVVGSLTFLPAVLAILGERHRLAAGSRIFGRPRPEGSGLWARIVRTVDAPARALVRPVGRVPAGTRAPGHPPAHRPERLRLVPRRGRLRPGDQPDEREVAAGHDARARGRRHRAPTNPRPGPRSSASTRPCSRSPGCRARRDPARPRTGRSRWSSYTWPAPRTTSRTGTIVRQVRSDAVPAVFGRAAGRAMSMSPATPPGPRIRRRSTRTACCRCSRSCSGLSFLLLLVAFRSVVIPIKAILLNLLSTGAAYGVMVLVFQEGFQGDSISRQAGRHRELRPGLHVHDPVRALDGLPRVHPDPDQGGPGSRAVGSNAAVERGIAITSGTVTSAAAIMVAVFAVFVTLQLVDHQAARARASRSRC